MSVVSRPIRLIAAAGSLRQGSFNRGLVRAARDLAPVGCTVEPFDLAGLPHYDADLQADGSDPASVTAWKAAIAGSDGLLLAVPEYNHSFSGVMKNAIDWASRPPRESPLEGLPVGIIGASDGPFGTARAQAAIRVVLAATGCMVMVRPAVMVPFARTIADDQGDIVDTDTRDRVAAWMIAFASWTRRLRTADDAA